MTASMDAAISDFNDGMRGYADAVNAFVGAVLELGRAAAAVVQPILDLAAALRPQTWADEVAVAVDATLEEAEAQFDAAIARLQGPRPGQVLMKVSDGTEWRDAARL